MIGSEAGSGDEFKKSPARIHCEDRLLAAAVALAKAGYFPGDVAAAGLYVGWNHALDAGWSYYRQFMTLLGALSQRGEASFGQTGNRAAQPCEDLIDGAAQQLAEEPEDDADTWKRELTKRPAVEHCEGTLLSAAAALARAGYDHQDIARAGLTVGLRYATEEGMPFYENFIRHLGSFSKNTLARLDHCDDRNGESGDGPTS